MRRGFRLALAAAIFLLLPGIAPAADFPDYPESLRLAIEHAADPAGWTTPSLLVIPDAAGGTEGLVYDGGKLVVRTAAKSRNFKTNYVGQAGYKIYGAATEEAAWVTTGNDATRFLLGNGVTGGNVTTLLERGLGMDATGTHDAIVEYAVDTQYLLRPTRNPDIAQVLPAQYGTNLPFVQPAGMSNEAFDNFKAYYAHWMAGAYGPYKFPWTQLGYTFFWGNGYPLARINGMSEFIILGQSPVDIYGIYATRSYIYTRNDGAAFSTAAGASYGNGFASFKVDGSCDTVWAGHRFQKNVSHDTADGKRNQILVENGGDLSGGQGLLVWSLNYDVVNSGTISGATADKFGIAGTANVAVLFKGDTGTTYGAPVITGVNRLTNSGIISSPGTAVKAEAGNTVIANNSGGVISGGAYAIQTGAGDDTVTVNGGEIAGRIDLGTGTDALTVTGASNARFTFNLNTDNASSAQIVNAESVTIADSSATLAVRVSGTRNVRNSDRFLVADAAALNVDPARLTILNDSALPMVTFAAEKTGGQLSLVAARNAAFYGQRSGNASLGAVLDSLAVSGSAEMAGVIGALDASGNAGNARKLEPVTNGGTLQAGFGAAGQFNQAVVDRIGRVMANHDTGSGVTGIATGDEPAREGVWGEGFGAALRQDPRGSSDGYRANIWGGSFGYDRFIFPQLLLGFGGGYAATSITTHDAGTGADVVSYQGSLYGSLARNAYYLDGLLSFARNQYDGSRHVAFGGLDRTAKGDYTGRQYSGYLEGGYAFEKSGFAITPLVSLQAMRLNIDSYTETGAGALNLSVEDQGYNLFQTGLGMKLAYPLRHRELRITPEFHAKWLHDFAGDRQQSTSQLTGGGAAFSTEGFEPARDSYLAGAKLTLMTKASVSVSLSYDLERKTDFYGHSGIVHVRYAF